MENKHEFAKVTWSVEDIKTMREDYTEDQCTDFLRNHQREIQDHMIEKGWDIIGDLLHQDERKERI